MYELKVEEDILIMAARYALGRRTFAPTTVQENIKYNIHSLTKRALTVIIRDIEGYRSTDSLGDDCDVETWNQIEELCRMELEDESRFAR